MCDPFYVYVPQMSDRAQAQIRFGSRNNIDCNVLASCSHAATMT